MHNEVTAADFLQREDALQEQRKKVKLLGKATGDSFHRDRCRLTSSRHNVL
jgi:hypothetical protein